MRGIRRFDFDELTPELQELLAPRVERLGYLGDFFRCAAHHPDALGHFTRFTETLKSALPPPLVETIALTASTVLGNAYERNQHERLCLALGMGEEWVRQVEDAAGSDARSDLPVELEVCRAYVRAAVSGRDPSAALEVMVDTLGDTTAVAVVLATARYVAHALIVRSLGLQPPVSSIFGESHEATNGARR